MPEPWCQGAFGILLHPSCGQQHCCPIPGRNNPQNTNLCFCKSLEGALTLECAHQVFKEAGDNTVSWRRTLCLCMNFTGLWLFVIKWDKQRFYGQRVVFCSSSATICSCGASRPLGCCMWKYHWSSPFRWLPWPIGHLLIIKLVGSLSLYFHCTYARINFCSW